MEFEREFFYDEVQDGFYVPGIMKRAWAAQLELLLEIDRICKKWNILYFITYGTLLGAVRHEGFIPWDDDIDIIMFRKDYEKFFQVAKEEINEDMHIISLEGNKAEYCFPNAIGRKAILSPEKLREVHEFPYPYAVDVFFLDELSEKEEDEEIRRNMIFMFMQMISAVRDKKEKTKLFQMDLEEIEKLLKIHFDRNQSLEGQFFRLMDKVFQEYNGECGEKVAFFPDYLNEDIVFSQSAFKESLDLPLYNKKFPAPKNYDEVLRDVYGDYKKKAKAGGAHDYPVFKKYEKGLQERLQGKWQFLYSFSEEDLERPNVKSFREIVLETADTLIASEKKIMQEFMEGNWENCLLRISHCQEEAITFGNAIEAKKGEGTEAVSFLEKYCEALYHAYKRIEELSKVEERLSDEAGYREERAEEKNGESVLHALPAGLRKDSERQLKKLGYYLKKMRSALEKEWKRQIVFLPHRAKHFVSLSPLIDALKESGDYDCKIIPIPYYDRLGDGSLSDMHYEGEDFPKEYEIGDYRSFNFAKELPDAIVINSPYDECNQVFTVDPFFYSKEMKKFTRKLVYIPYFVTDEIDQKSEEDGKAFVNMDYYVTVPGVFHADLTIVQSKEMKKAYLAKISQFTNKDVRKKMSKKISGAGSCLIQEKKEQGTEEPEMKEARTKGQGTKESGAKEQGEKALVKAFRRFIEKE